MERLEKEHREISRRREERLNKERVKEVYRKLNDLPSVVD